MSARFGNIDLLRAFAATAVVVYHVIEHRHWESFPVDGPLVVYRIGWIGVDLFFVISGFVITWSALALWRRDAPRFPRRYWAHRLSRICPLYLVTGVLWVALFKPDFFDASVKAWVWQIVSHLTFTHTLTPWTYGSINGVNWTVAIEMQFYLAVALLIPWIARTPGWRIWLGCIAVAWGWRAAMTLILGPMGAERLFVGVMQLPGVLDEFGAGIFLARLLERGGGTSLRRGALWAAGAVGAGTLCMSVYWSHSSFWDLPLMVVFWRTLAGAFFGCVVAAAVHLPSLAGTWPLRPIRYLGVVSYGIYLWHLFAVRWVQDASSITSLQALGIVLAATLALAALSWHGFERATLGWGHRYGEEGEAAGAAAAPAARPLPPAG